MISRLYSRCAVRFPVPFSIPFGRLLGLVTVAISIALIGASVRGQETADVAAVERRVQAVYEKVRPAIVQVEYATITRLRPGVIAGGRHRTGVILTKEGHVVARGDTSTNRSTKVRSGAIAITLPDGRRVAATALGWSDEWNIELLKITDKGPWPHVEIDDSIKVRVGQYCVVVGYPKRDFEFENQPSIRLGLINQSAFPFWVSSSVPTRASRGGLFDLEGRLLGVTTRTFLEGVSTHTGIQVLKEQWHELIAAGNIDRVRSDSAERESTNEAPSTNPKSGNEKEVAIKLAKSVTVRVGIAGRKGGSGVIVTAEGHVISHAHGGVKLPGQLVTISLADGRDVKGKVLGSNAISDITMIKITDKGPWPHANFGRSTMMRSGDKCIFAGYPQKYKGREPLIREMQLATRKNHAWSSLLTATSEFGLQGGDSGGGLFDLTGRLIGKASHGGGSPPLHFFQRVEMIQEQWDMLSDESLITLTRNCSTSRGLIRPTSRIRLVTSLVVLPQPWWRYWSTASPVYWERSSAATD